MTDLIRANKEVRFIGAQIKRLLINKEVMILISLFAIALAFRLHNLDNDPHGDEAFYFYLSRNPQYYFTTPEATSHPPLLYYLYHPFSQTLVNFRVVNVLIGSLVPCIVYLIMIEKNVKTPIRVLAASILTFHSILVKYSNLVFLDMLGTFFALMALLLYLRGSQRAYVVTLFLAMMTKEYFVIFALALIITNFLSKRGIHKPTTISLGAFGAWSLIHYLLRGPPTFLLYMHSRNPLDLFGLNRMFLNLLLIPAMVLTFQRKNIELVSISAIHPIFLFFWGTCEEWYLLLPIAINICLIALALNQFLDPNFLSNFPKILTKKKIVTATLIIIMITLTIELLLTVNYIQARPIHDLKEVTDILRSEYREQNITIIDCFWALKYYPLGEFMNVSSEGWSNQESFEILQEKIREAGLCILGKTDGDVNRDLQRSFNESVVRYNSSRYMIIDFRKHP